MPLEPNEDLRKMAENYIGVFTPVFGRRIVEGHYVEVNRSRAEAIAGEYELLPDDLSFQPDTAEAYYALVEELTWQWHAIRGHGYVMEPWEKEGQPYANSKEMQEDVRENKHLFYFTGGESHPFLDSIVEGVGVTGTEMLRAVHDIFGHAAEGYGFGARGEENAWIHHSMMFSPLAQKALTTETRGQNSWVNFGPYSHLPVTERPYAMQKVALLPAWCCDWEGALNE